MKIRWSVNATADEGYEHGQWIGYGNTPQEALADLHATLQLQADTAMGRAAEVTKAVARVRGELAALGAE